MQTWSKRAIKPGGAGLLPVGVVLAAGVGVVAAAGGAGIVAVVPVSAASTEVRAEAAAKFRGKPKWDPYL